jgi:hypothetical protein
MATQRRPGQSWEDFAEERIRDAQEQGEFDALPGFGQPIPGIDQPHDELWWVKEKLKRERLSHLPPSLAIKRDVELTLQRIAALTDEADVRREVRELNNRIREANYRSVWGPPSTQLPLDEEEIVTQWRRSRAGFAP